MTDLHTPKQRVADHPPDDPWHSEQGCIQLAMEYPWCRNPLGTTVWRDKPPGRAVGGMLFESLGRISKRR